jgi:hypothetical protein
MYEDSASGVRRMGMRLKKLGGPETPEERIFADVSELEDELHG